MAYPIGCGEACEKCGRVFEVCRCPYWGEKENPNLDIDPGLLPQLLHDIESFFSGVAKLLTKEKS